LKPLVVLFIPVISISIYKMMSKVMLGQFSTVTQVGYYANAEKLVNLPNNIITALGTVMLPRISYLVANRDNDTTNRYTTISLTFISCIAPLMAFGIAGIAPELTVAFYGNEFIGSGSILKILSFTVIAAALATVIRTQFLIPNEKDKLYIIAVGTGAVLNFVFNLITIPKYGAFGAAIGTVLAEITVAIIQLVGSWGKILYKEYFINTICYSVIGTVMYICLRLISGKINNLILTIGVQVVLGMCIYGVLSVIYIMIRSKKNARELLFDFKKTIKS
ncbi:polysaccharide biosynthesis C-terminal domain-containing protein, partial [Streptomyces noursei]|uniref:lipid II flippase MurJ n=1 Tax=Streptomyces noursei TaxID=1971 RepID=UPI003624E8A0